jgi:hypothetical protein
MLHTAQLSPLIVRGDFPGIFCRPYLCTPEVYTDSNLRVSQWRYRPAHLLVLLVQIFKWNQFSNPLGNSGLDRLCLVRVERFHTVRCPKHSRWIWDLETGTLICETAAFISHGLKFHETRGRKLSPTRSSKTVASRLLVQPMFKKIPHVTLAIRHRIFSVLVNYTCYPPYGLNDFKILASELHLSVRLVLRKNMNF